MHRFLPVLLLLSALAAAQPLPPPLAPTPPMGWNSWDSYGTTVDEAAIERNADWMQAHLARFGWSYITVDMEWFVRDPKPSGNSAAAGRVLDAYGRYLPDPARFPSSANGRGFAPLATYVHAWGLKFGIHILQGIPREALVRNSPIEGSRFHALDAADPGGTCRWNPDNFDLRANAAGQSYYDSLARLYASWGVDLIKIDCITAPRFKGEEIAMFRRALNKTGRPIVLSLSPGEPSIDHAAEIRAGAEQWRISNDVWDLWHNEELYPQGVGDQFARLAYWSRTRRPGHWPDADMLPLGSLRPAPPVGSPRETRLTHAEQRTMLTLWAVFRSPLTMGGDLPRTDAWTESLLTNRDVIALDQHSTGNRVALERPESVVWRAGTPDGRSTYLAVFNRTGQPLAFAADWTELGLRSPPETVRDLWEGKTSPGAPALRLTLEPHGCALLLVPDIQLR